VESSCEFGIEPSASIRKAGKLTSGLLSSAQLHRVSYLLTCSISGDCLANMDFWNKIN
jgi:hypothetical protein